MGSYAAAARTVNRLTAEYGGTVTFTRKVSGTFNPVTQTETASSTLTFALNGIALSPGRSAEYRIGSLVNRKIIEFHCAPNLGNVPEPGDVATWGGKDWRVIWSNDLDPAGDGAPYCLVYAER